MGKFYKIFILLIAILLMSCSTLKKVPVETSIKENDVKEIHDTVTVIQQVLVEVERNHSDSTRESVTTNRTVTVNEAGDTLRTDTYIERNSDRTIRDENTMLKCRLDSVMKINNTLKEHLNEHSRQEPILIEKELTAWQSFRLRAFWWLVGAIMAFVAYTFKSPLFKFIKTLI